MGLPPASGLGSGQLADRELGCTNVGGPPVGGLRMQTISTSKKSTDRARTGGLLRPLTLKALGGSALVATLCVFGLSSVGSADPSSQSQLQGAQAQASQLESQLRTDSYRLDVLDQQYETAQQQVQALDASLLSTGAKIAAIEVTVNEAQTVLRQEALSIYTGNGASSPLAQMFSPGNMKTSLLQAYQHVASANVSATIDHLRVSQAALDQQESQLQATESQAQAASAQIAQSQSQAQAVVASEQASLAQVRGQIATLALQQQAAQQAAEAAAFSARYGLNPNAPVSPAAGAAIQAAESQLGVPYQWGGEQPGVGFDCSGLTQWSWGQAGVSIPRTAQDQYDAIAKAPLSDLEPGDLLFWDDGTDSVQHVAMYVGNGQVIQAPQTGQDVSYSAIWTDGLVGAGRP